MQRSLHMLSSLHIHAQVLHVLMVATGSRQRAPCVEPRVVLVHGWNLATCERQSAHAVCKCMHVNDGNVSCGQEGTPPGLRRAAKALLCMQGVFFAAKQGVC